MSWEISRLIIDASGNWGVEFTNVSGSTLNTDDFQFLISSTVTSSVTTVNFSVDGNAIVPAGGSFVYGNSNLAEADFGFAGWTAHNTYDLFGIATSGGVPIDTIGDADSGSATWAANTIYTADALRSADTNTTDSFSINNDFTSGVYCFLEGTRIATPSGETCIEDLRTGDLIMADGKAVIVKWVGRQAVSTRFGPAERLMPVRFAAGSLGEGLPHTDLTVTADHGMLIDGVICQAGALVNGTTITRVPLDEMGEAFTVYHIETEAHEIILANGAPAETFIDNVSRRVFDNFAEFEALYGDVPEMEELPYPRAMSARQVPMGLRAKLGLQRAA